MAEQSQLEILKKIAVNIVLQNLGEQMLALVKSCLISRSDAVLDKDGDLACSLDQLGQTLEDIIGTNETQLVLQQIYIEIDALTEMSKLDAD